MPVVTQGGTRLFWREDGDNTKPPLLLLNSIGTSLEVWDRLVPLLAPYHRILRMDTRGHGQSEAPGGDYTLTLLAADALAVLDAAGAERAVVCGLSLGGMIAMTLALEAPSRVETLVLICTSAAMDKDAWDARITRVRAGGMAVITEMALDRFFADSFRQTHPEAVAPVRAGLLATPPHGYAACGAAIRDMDLEGQLGNIAVPVLVIAGTKDVSTPYQGHGDKIAAAIPGASAVLLDAAHLAPLEEPAGVARAIRGFLADPSVTHAMETLLEAGLKNRRTVLGDAWVDRSLANRTSFNSDFQSMITRIAWHEIWGRPGLDHRTRRLLVLAITAALGRWEEFRLHVKSGLQQNGFTEEELKETLMQTAIYAGVPAANTAFAEAAEIIREIKEKTIS